MINQLYNKDRIRTIPGIPNHFLTRSGLVYNADSQELYGAYTPGYIECRVGYYVNGNKYPRIVYLDAEQTYMAVWGVRPPKNVWVNRIGKSAKIMDVESALNVDMWKALEMCEPKVDGDTYQLKVINDWLIELLKKHKIDYKEEIKKLRGDE